MHLIIFHDIIGGLPPDVSMSQVLGLGLDAVFRVKGGPATSQRFPFPCVCPAGDFSSLHGMGGWVCGQVRALSRALYRCRLLLSARDGRMGM